MNKAMAEELESQAVTPDDKDLVINYYDSACRMFELDEYGKSQLSNCRKKLADYAADAGELKKAIDIYESEARKCLENNLTTFGAKDLFFQAGILELVRGDSITCKIKLQSYQNEDPRFEKSLEGSMFSKCVAAFDNEDEQAFVNAIAEYNEIKPLSNFQSKHLLTVRQKLARGQAGSMDLGGGAQAQEESDDDLR